MKKFICKFYLAIIMIFLYAPILVLIVSSFNNSKSRVVWGGFTLKWYAEIFSTSVVRTALQNTVVLALGSAFIATLIALIACIGIDAMRRKEYSIVMAVTNIPMLNADIVTGIAMMLLLIRFMPLGFSSIMLAHITFNIPYVILSILPRFNQLDVSIYEAARDLGAGPVYSFFKVVLPELVPGIISGFFMAVTMSMDDFVITYFTKGAGINTLSTMIYSQIRKGIQPSMYALSTVIFLLTVLVLIIVNVVTAPPKKQHQKQVIMK
ncbi:MAG: ABC transporter permease [Lachnospiraceae bacterium]